jgi:hypothetical protein
MEPAMPLKTAEATPSRSGIASLVVGRKGIALVSILFILVSLPILTATLFLTSFLDSQAISNVSAGDDALYVAEAGIQHLWSLLEPATDFARELAWPDGIPPFGSPTGFPKPPRTYRVRVDGLADGRLRARSEGTSHRGARRVVEAIFLRELQFRPPAVLTIAAAAPPSDLSGALDVSAEPGGEVPAYGAETREAAEAFRSARTNAPEVAIVGSSGMWDAIDRLREIARVTLDGPQVSGSFGSAVEPVVVRFTGSADVSGTVTVTGIVLADAPLRVHGRLEIDGLLVAPLGIDVEGETVIRGAAWLAGDARITATAALRMHYSEEALDQSAQAAPGVLPRAAILGAWREVW